MERPSLRGGRNRVPARREKRRECLDAVKVESLSFTKTIGSISLRAGSGNSEERPGKPVSVSWIRKSDGSSGTIHFDYLVDASGRAGLVSTKYMKTRIPNKRLQSMAVWGYWKGAGTYGPGAGDPFSEALPDGSGWAWFIPLHNGMVSVGVTIKQEQVVAEKRAYGSSAGREFYLACLQDTPGIANLLCNAELESSDIKSAGPIP